MKKKSTAVEKKSTLVEEIPLLTELNELRNKAKLLREKGFASLAAFTPQTAEEAGQLTEKEHYWIGSGDAVETALLVKVQSHKDIGGSKSEASIGLVERLKSLKLSDLFPAKEGPRDEMVGNVPVLVAARAMQALTQSSATAFSKSTMRCYYRIVRELYLADSPDWIVGGAKAGKGGHASAFVTGECIRAILSFEGTIRRTIVFFEKTLELKKQFDRLERMPDALNDWVKIEFERIGMDWYLSTNHRLGEIALDFKGAPDLGANERIDREQLQDYLLRLPAVLCTSIKLAAKNFQAVCVEAEQFREAEREARENSRLERSMSAHKVAVRILEYAEKKASKASKDCDNGIGIENILSDLKTDFEQIARDVHLALEPAKRYVKTVLDRELAASHNRSSDLGELVFAAASYGATIDWQQDEMVKRACSLLSSSISENGTILTKRPFHSLENGYRLFPAGFELIRGMAQLIQKVEGTIQPDVVRRMLKPFEDNLMEERGAFGWNFENPPIPRRCSVWVTSIAVMALDRIVRMINEQINKKVFRYFDVVDPRKVSQGLRLDELVYPDYGFSLHHKDKPSKPVSILLEEMRAHVMRVDLPLVYEKEKVYSTIFYGPPGTGKTTLAEALAVSCDAPLVRLSAANLIAQGERAIERQALAIFESLSMLTQSVIIFDEFEDVMLSRSWERERKPVANEMISWLRTGMLPKIKKLHESAKGQSFAYCMATNIFKKIDTAAKRKGRFDSYVPIYHPDPMSRAGLMRYRMELFKEGDTDLAKMMMTNVKEDKALMQRILTSVVDTNCVPVAALASDWFRTPRKGNIDELTQYWLFILRNEKKPSLSSDDRASYALSQTPPEEAEENRGAYERTEEEDHQVDWIQKWEERLKEKSETTQKKQGRKILEVLTESIPPKSPR